MLVDGRSGRKDGRVWLQNGISVFSNSPLLGWLWAGETEMAQVWQCPTVALPMRGKGPRRGAGRRGCFHSFSISYQAYRCRTVLVGPSVLHPSIPLTRSKPSIPPPCFPVQSMTVAEACVDARRHKEAPTTHRLSKMWMRVCELSRHQKVNISTTLRTRTATVRPALSIRISSARSTL